MLRVALILHSARSDNLGVGALTVSQVEILRDIESRLGIPIDISVLDWKGSRAPFISGPDITIHDLARRDMMNPRGVYRLLRQADLVLDIGAGDSFADIYGAHRIRRLLLMKYLVHLARRPLVLAPQTYGPFTARSTRLLARLSIAQAALVAARDLNSVTELRRLGVTRPVIEASDVALRLPFERVERPAEAPLRVGLNISGLMMSGGYHSANQFGLRVDYPAMIRKLISALRQHPDGPEIHLIPHVISPERPEEDDRIAAQELAAEFPGLILAPAFETPSQAKSYIAGMDFFTGARMHACIAALSTHVPVIPMAYSQKFEGLFGTMGYGETVDLRQVETDLAVARILSGLERRRALAAQVRLADRRGRGFLACYTDAMTDLVARVARAKGARPADQPEEMLGEGPVRSPALATVLTKEK